MKSHDQSSRNQKKSWLSKSTHDQPSCSNTRADCLNQSKVSFTFGSIASPANFVAQFNVPVASTASSVDVSPRWSELGLNYPANTDTAVSSSIASPAWSEVGLTYQANLDASAHAVQHAFCRGLRPRHPTSRGDHTRNPQVHPAQP